MGRHLILIVAGLLAALVSVTHAQETPNEQRSRALFTQAAERYDAGQPAEALRLYRESYRLVPRAKTLLNIGVVLSELGRDAEAANALAEYARDPDADRDRVAKVKELLRELDAKLVRVELNIERPGEVKLDGRTVGNGPLEAIVRVGPGEHVVTVAGERRPFERNIGESVIVAFKPLEVKVDAKPEPPPTAPSPPIRDDGPSIASHPALWTGVLAIAAAGVGGGYALAFRSVQNDLDDLNANSEMHPFTEALRLRDKAEDRALVANIAFGVAGVAAATTAVLFFVVDRSPAPAPTGATLAPMAGPNILGANLSGRF